MQSEKNEVNNGGKKSEKSPVKKRTIEYHLKAAHAIYCEEVRVLKLQVKGLRSKLKEITSREFKCTQCVNTKESLDKQTVAFEEKLREQDTIINELRHKLEVYELQTCNEAFGQTNHCAKKRKLNCRKDFITLKENRELNPSSDDDVKILTVKLDRTNSCFNKAKTSTELECANSVNPVLVPDTLDEDIEIKISSVGNPKNAIVVVPETLRIEIDFREEESPVFNNPLSKSTENRTLIGEESVPQCLPVETTENPKSTSTTITHEKRMSEQVPNKCFHGLVIEDLDLSMDEFQMEPTRKGKLSKSARSCEPTNENNFKNKTTSTRKVKTPSPRPKYKLHFSPARQGHRKPKYKQTTLTQKTFGTWQDTETSDYDLKKAIEESLRNHKATRQQDKVIEEEHTANDNTGNNSFHTQNDSCLDATFVSSQLLRKTRSHKDGIAISKASKSNATEETKINHFVAVDDTPDSEDLIEQMLNQPSPNRERNSKNSGSTNQIPLEPIPMQEDDNCIDDFDIAPNNKISGPNYKYKEPTVRKQDERRKLDGFECRECAAYVAAMGLGDEEKKRRLKECSRHRGKYALPATPEHFWSIDFPSTQECKDRGVMNQTQYKPLQRRRRRSLK